MRRLALCLALAALLATACGDDGDDRADQSVLPDTSGAASAPTEVLVFSGQANDLVAYRVGRAVPGHAETPGGALQFQLTEPERAVVIENAGDDPDGRDVNGQVCFLDERTFVAGEDTGQPDPPAGFGLFSLRGDTVADLSAEQIGKLTPPFAAAASQPEPYGCAVLDDGRLVTTDVGNQSAGPGTGQLVVWFDPLDGEDAAFCVVDDAIATAQQVAVDGTDVLVASARPPTIGVWRYTDLPEGPTPEEGCPAEPAPTRELFIEAGPDGLAVTNGVTAAPGGDGWYVSSVISGVINQYDPSGSFVRQVLAPPAGEELGPEPYSTGTPLGLAFGPDGRLYYADIGIVFDGDFGPGDRTGAIRRIDLTGDEPAAPETVEAGLA
ncbi:MAG: hypothetical protein AAGK32_14625, partial [Actinomycetota bacterium]